MHIPTSVIAALRRGNLAEWSRLCQLGIEFPFGGKLRVRDVSQIADIIDNAVRPYYIVA